jgi:phosphatidylinositol alpha-1,6-mannosyltransferase
MPDLLARGHDVIYLIVGDGDDRIRLEQLARTARVEDRVHFLGALDADPLVQVYRAADLFVMPSTGEGFGISFLEAMACGTPALGLAAGGAPDALGDGALGTMVCESDLPRALHDALSGAHPDRQALSSAVLARFSRTVFRDSVNGTVARLRDPAREPLIVRG